MKFVHFMVEFHPEIGRISGTKSPKLLLSDTGLLVHLLGADAD